MDQADEDDFKIALGETFATVAEVYMHVVAPRSDVWLETILARMRERWTAQDLRDHARGYRERADGSPFVLLLRPLPRPDPITDADIAAHADTLARIVMTLGITNTHRFWVPLRDRWGSADLRRAIEGFERDGDLAPFRALGARRA